MKTKYIPLILGSIFLIACEEKKGTILINDVLHLKGAKKVDLAIPAGNYNAKVGASGSKVELSVTLAKDNTVKAKFTVPKGLKIKSFNDIKIIAADSGQPYDIIGFEDTEYQDGPIINTTESCTWYSTVTECGNETTPLKCHQVTECNPEIPDQCEVREVCSGGETTYVCRDVSVSHQGRQDVTYYETDRYTRRFIDLMNPADGKHMARFSNFATGSTRHDISEGPCISSPWDF
jgi:hypothetical protein